MSPAGRPPGARRGTTPAERLVDALLDRDLARLRALQDEPGLQEVVRAALARLDPAPHLDEVDVEVLRHVAGHPGLSAAALTEHLPRFPDVAPRLRDLGLLSDSRFGRADCWSRTAAGAAVLRAR